MSIDPNIITVENLVVKYGDFVALNDISFSVKKGEIFGLLGPNGAGKSTSIKVLTTLLKPFSGKIEIMGFDTKKDVDKVREKIALVMQEHALDLFLSVYGNLYFYAMLERIPRKERKKRILELLELFGLFEKKDSSIISLSGGLFRRVQFARIFLSSAEIFFLDEPTLGIDIKGKEKYWNFLKMVGKKMNITMVVATNDLHEAERLCDRIIFINNGEIVTLGTPEKLKELMDLKILVVKISNYLNFKELTKQNSIIRGYKLKEDNVIEIEILNDHKDFNQSLSKLKTLGDFQIIEYRNPSLEDVFFSLIKER